MTIIQIAPIKINPWSWIAKKIGKAINGEVIDRVNALETSVNGVRSELSESNAINCRCRIIRFGDELSRGHNHTKEHFRQTLSDIDQYNLYCEEHPNFKNSMTVSTVALILEVYHKQLQNNDFA